MTAQMTKYAVIQIGNEIYGVGDSKREAIESASEWVDPGSLVDLKSPHECNDGDITVVRCSAALADFVEKHGSCNFDHISKSEICLPEENE